MENAKRLICANDACKRCRSKSYGNCRYCVIGTAPTVDAVLVDDIEAWLYQIAMNNTDNTLGVACEEIISRLDGLRRFSKERGTV